MQQHCMMTCCSFHESVNYVVCSYCGILEWTPEHKSTTLQRIVKFPGPNLPIFRNESSIRSVYLFLSKPHNYRKCYSELSPVCAVVGGVLGQEVIKVRGSHDPSL